jgi:ATP-dependent Clp protease, protease subunit
MSETWNFKIVDAATTAAPDTIEIAIYDRIGRTFWGDGVGAKDVLDAVKATPKAKSILIRVNSVGGIVDEAKAMVTLLAERVEAGISVEFRVDSLAASAAAYLLTTKGAKVVVAENAYVMIHKARAMVAGTDADMDVAAARLRAANQLLADAFASASSSRGKAKTSADFMAQMANNADRYFSASEAIEWGLADSTTKAALKIAACAVDISELTDVPEPVRTAPYATAPREEPAPPAPALPTPEPIPAPSLPAPVASEKPAPPEERNPMSEPTNATPSVARALGLPAGSSETDIVAAATRIRELELQILAITGAQISGEALGAIRGIKASADRAAALETECTQLKAERDQQNFDALVMKGSSAPVKLSPATVKHYTDRFTAAKEAGRGAEVVADLKGFLDVAPTIIAERKTPPAPGGGGGGTPTHNGKTYAELKPLERARLAQSEPDLFRAMKQEHEAQAGV